MSGMFHVKHEFVYEIHFHCAIIKLTGKSGLLPAFSQKKLKIQVKTHRFTEGGKS